MKKILITSSAIVALFASMAFANLDKREHYRCWDHTLRVSHGGWVSYKSMAIQNCQNALAVYPTHSMEVETAKY